MSVAGPAAASRNTTVPHHPHRPQTYIMTSVYVFIMTAFTKKEKIDKIFKGNQTLWSKAFFVGVDVNVNHELLAWLKQPKLLQSPR